jgi:hypothetical protein
MWVFGHTPSELGRSELQRLGLVLSLLALLLAAPAGPALGYGYTSVAPPPTTEDNHLEILTIIYGGTWSVDANGRDFSNNGGITATRVYDFNSGDEIIHVLDGDETNVDQIWTDGIVTVTAEVKYAGHNQSFGWNGGEGVGGVDTTNYYELLTDADLLLGTEVEIDITGNFLWGIHPNGDEWWSKQSYNADGSDHLVTYFIENVPGLEDETVWLLLWEDLPDTGDMDYNDFVIQVQAVPEPGTAFLLGTVLAGLAVFRCRRRGA